jgi:hypothetical protein
MDQEVKYIKIEDLVLWTENPRDPIDPNATDQDIVNKAFDDKLSKWSLPKLARQMGSHYDFSELPTVVYEDEKPIVYDGNRRIILGKIKLGYASLPTKVRILIPDFPEKIPCNVCAKKIALDNIYRKHSGTGSWDPLERDIFLYKFMGKGKSDFLIIEEDTGIIGAHPHLNLGLVKKEVFNPKNLKALGFAIQNGRFHSVHSNEETAAILAEISQKVADKVIETRGERRGRVIEVLSPLSQQIIDQNKNKKLKPYTANFTLREDIDRTLRQARRTRKRENQIFGGKLYLRTGSISDIYRDIFALYEFYIDNKFNLSQSFPALIRMSLRLLCEAAAKDESKDLQTYLKDNFDEAKKTLSQDIKTTLAAQNVKKETLVQLLHTGAHDYQSSTNIDQTIAISIIVGAIITITHGQ